MKRSKHLHILFFFLGYSFLFHSCSIEKRRHLSGYNVQWRSKPKKVEVENRRQEQFQNVENKTHSFAKTEEEDQKPFNPASNTSRDLNDRTVSLIIEDRVEKIQKKKKEESFGGEYFEKNEFEIARLEKQMKSWEVVMYISAGLTFFLFFFGLVFAVALIFYTKKKKELAALRAMNEENNSGEEQEAESSSDDGEIDYVQEGREGNVRDKSATSKNVSGSVGMGLLWFLIILLFIAVILILFVFLLYFFSA